MLNVVMLLCVVGCYGDKLRNASHLLDTLLNTETYDKRLRPGFEQRLPTKVLVDLNIRSMGPISEVDQTYSMDTYFRQTWSDERLQFSQEYDELVVSTMILDQMWIPDTYFYNGLGSYLHTTTVPNKLLRIRPDGEILYSMRITIKASCPMYLHFFPIDQQSCPLHIGSYAYTRDQVVYQWKRGAGKSIETPKDMRLSQFTLVRIPASSIIVKNASGEFSTLAADFVLQRDMGYFLIQVYVPCTLIVVLSWVSLWINREATEDRVSLGILCELTLTTVSMDTRDDLPKVPYATALDWFLIMSYLFITSTLIEYAIVHYFTKIGSGDIASEDYDLQIDKEEDEDDDEEDEDDDDMYEDVETLHNGCAGQITTTWSAVDKSYLSTVTYPHRRNQRDCTCHSRGITHHYYSGEEPEGEEEEDEEPKRRNRRKRRDDRWGYRCLMCLQGSAHFRKRLMKRANKDGINTVSQIDKVSRVLFPLSFLMLNLIYWITIAC